MSMPFRTVAWLCGSALIAGLPSVAAAELVRFRFVPVGSDSAMRQVPIGPEGAMGELRAVLGGTPRPYNGTFPPNRLVTFRHPYTSKNVTIPMKLPGSTPEVERIGDRLRLNYGTYYVEARFLPDGGVDVVYNSGFLRKLPP
jgi:hypothetical protein